MDIVSRKGWGAKAPESRTPWDISSREGVVQHWFGSPRAASSHGGCAALLRSVQTTHMNGEFSDIAYNFGVCPHGTAYELRGWGTQTGANGNADANRRYVAFVYMAGTGDPLTEVAKTTLRFLYAEAFKRGVAKKAITHGSITGSECPGPGLRAWLSSGQWRTIPEAEKKVRYILMDGDGKSMTASTWFIPDSTEQKILVNWFTRRAAPALKELRADGDIGIRREKEK